MSKPNPKRKRPNPAVKDIQALRDDLAGEAFDQLADIGRTFIHGLLSNLLPHQPTPRTVDANPHLRCIECGTPVFVPDGLDIKKIEGQKLICLPCYSKNHTAEEFKEIWNQAGYANAGRSDLRSHAVKPRSGSNLDIPDDGNTIDIKVSK